MQIMATTKPCTTSETLPRLKRLENFPYRVMLVDSDHGVYKVIVTPKEYNMASFRVGKQVVDADYRPDIVLAVWRGGAPPAMIITGLLEFYGTVPDHFPIQSYRYTEKPGKTKPIGIRSMSEAIAIINGKKANIQNEKKKHKRILLCDDVFDEGITMEELHNQLRCKVKHDPTIKIATVFWKPYANRTSLEPYFYDRTLDEIEIDGYRRKPWIVFPHEINELPGDELRLAYPEVYKILETSRKRR
jgi:hypoxanthine phosphoribosyltransferase